MAEFLPIISDSVVLAMGIQICISIKFQGDADVDTGPYSGDPYSKDPNVNTAEFHDCEVKGRWIDLIIRVDKSNTLNFVGPPLSE